MSKRFEVCITQVSTLLVASVLLRVVQGFSSSGKDLPSLVREKRLTDVLDEPGDDETNENIFNSQKRNDIANDTPDIEGETYDNTKDRPKPTLDPANIHRGERRVSSQEINRNSSRKNARDLSTTGKYDRKKQLESQKSSRTNENRRSIRVFHSRAHLPMNTKRHNKVILPRVKFGWLSQEVSSYRAPPPSRKQQHQMRMKMKRKKRRRLRALKRITKSRTDEKQNEERNKATEVTGGSKAASLHWEMKAAHNTTEMTPTTSFSDKMTANNQGTHLPSPLPSLTLTKSAKINNTQSLGVFVHAQSQNVKGIVTDSPRASTLKRPKRIPQKAKSSPMTRKSSRTSSPNRFSSLEITLKSKILSLNPDLSATSNTAQTSPLHSPSMSSLSIGRSPSLGEMPAEDLLRNFFNNAGSLNSGTVTGNDKTNQDDARDPRDEIPADGSRGDTRPSAQHKHVVKMKHEKRNQDDDDYEFKLLEFQKQTIEEEEKRLKEEFGLERQNTREAKRDNRLKRLDRKNEEKEKEVHLLLEKFTKRDKQNGKSYLKPNVRPYTASKRSFMNTMGSDIDDAGDETYDDDVDVKAFSNRQKRKMIQSKNKGMIKKQRKINAGGDSRNDDEITEMAYYDNQDQIAHQNTDTDGATHSKTATESKVWDRDADSGKHLGLKDTATSLKSEHDSDASNGLKYDTFGKEENGKIRNSIDLQAGELEKSSSEKEEKQMGNKIEKEDKDLQQDSIEMEYDDLMKDEEKKKAGESKGKTEIEVDISREHSPEMQQNVERKKERNMENTHLMENDSEKKDDRDGDVEVQVDADNPNPPIFTEIKDEEVKNGKDQEAGDSIETVLGKQENELQHAERISEIAEYGNHLLGNKARNNSNTALTTTITTTTINNSSSSNKWNGDKVNSNSTNQQNKNEDDGNVLLHDKRLMYILTGKGGKPPKRKYTDPKQNSVQIPNKNQPTTIAGLKEIQKDLAANGHELLGMQKQQSNKGVGKPLISKQMVINKGLKTKVKEMHNRILNAHNRVSQELEQMEQELSNKFETLQESMSMAKTFTTNINNKINNSVHNVVKLATSSAKQARAKLELVRKAAAALNRIEDKIGANETRIFAGILKSKLPNLPAQKNKTYQKILAINNIITKMDGAKIIALERANASYDDKVKIENSMSEAAGNVLNELESTEKELNDDTEMEIEDEIEADRKIRDAKTRNYKAAVKTAQALEKIEGYLKQLENDENRLRALEN